MDQWAEQVIRARWLIASLGEAAAPKWWRSEATGTAGRRMLEILFPRTALAASLETAGRAAALEHDTRIGVDGVYHLFRLPAGEEVAIGDTLHAPEGRVLLAELVADRTPQERLVALRQLAPGQPATDGQGPVRCGDVADIRDLAVVARICAAYADAFAGDYRVYPYLTEATS